MGLDAIKSQYRSKVAQIGRNALGTLFPKDFEIYFLAIELVDSQNNTVDYFSWPVLPDEVSDTHNEITTIRKTIGGVNTQKNSTFTPRQIIVRGTFGREFKLLLGGQEIVFAGFGLSIKNGKFNVSTPFSLDNPVPQFSSFAKTGYGCVKLLQSIKDKSKQLDDYGKPFSLYFYNPILGDNYQVEFNQFRHMQDSARYNMIPMYQIQLTAIAPLDSVLSRKANLKSALKNVTLSNLQKTANTVASNLRLIPNLF